MQDPKITRTRTAHLLNPSAPRGLHRVLYLGFDSKLIQENSHRGFLPHAKGFRHVGHLVLNAPQSEGGVDNHEDEGENDSGQKDEDTAHHVDEEVANTECAQHHNSRVVLLQSLQRGLGVGAIVESSKQDAHGENPEEHLPWMEEADEEEDEDRRDCVVSLVVQQVVHDTVHPFLNIAEVGSLKPGLPEDKFIQIAERCKFHLVHDVTVDCLIV